MRRALPNTVIAAWRGARGLRVELHVTPCIVTSPPGSSCDALVNPANERLQGTSFTPSECSRNLAPGTTLIYPPQVVDGLVSELGGAAIATACAMLPIVGDGDVRCRTGDAVATAAFGELLVGYDHIVHAVAPFYGSSAKPQTELLMSTFHSAFRVAESLGAASVAVPLMGSGARGWPVGEAAAVAAEAAAEWCGGRGVLELIRFGVQHDEAAHALSERLDLQAALEREAVLPVGEAG